MLASSRGRAAPHHSPQGNGRTMCAPTGLGNEKHLGQHRTIPALRLKHRSGGCGTASALPKCSIMSGCGTRIVLRFAASATGGAHLCSIQYYLRFWLSSCRASLAVSALRIMRYCHKSKIRHYPLPPRSASRSLRVSMSRSSAAGVGSRRIACGWARSTALPPQPCGR